MSNSEDSKSFWEHLDDLRGCLIKILAVVVVFTIIAFCAKNIIFKIVLAPKNSSFLLFKLIGAETFSVELMNIGLTEQFMVHLKTAFVFGILAAMPYIVKVLFDFISPALYENEKKYSSSVVICGYFLFMVGVLLNYFLVFPLTVRFLGTYQVSGEVANMLTLQSYMDTLLTMSLVFGIMFEIPIVSWLLAKIGILKAEYMTKYRRHAIVAILVLAAIITPTADAFTLIIVSLPIWMLYELSVLVVRRTELKSVN